MDNHNKTRTTLVLISVSLLIAAAASQASIDDSLGTSLDLEMNEEPERLRITLEEYLENLQDPASASAPTPTDYDEIRPGQLILTNVPGAGSFICTLSFVFKDNTAGVTKYYAGTAGHCVLPDWAVSTHGSGANYNASGVGVQVCVDNCEFGGALAGFGASMVGIGPVVYARQTNSTSFGGICPAGDIGNDFALIEIPEIWYNKSLPFQYVRSDMAVWDGPHGSNSFESTGVLLGFHGNGVVAGTSQPTKWRTLESLDDGIVCSWQAGGGPVHGGDSGSPVARLGPHSGSMLHGTQALGTATHALIGAGADAFGTTIDWSIWMAWQDAKLDVSLVDAVTPIP